MNDIHPTVIIGENVVLGDNNKILPYTIIEGSVRIGNNNVIGPHVVIGCPATDTRHVDYGYENAFVCIGNNNIIREFSIIEQPCYESETIIQNEVFLMQGVHVSHDVCIADKVVVTNASVLAGVVKILKGANIAMACTINQYTVIGHYSIAATNTAVMKNIKPFSRYIPNRPLSVNNYALEKYGLKKYEDEISDYVLNDRPVSTPILIEIVDEFEYWTGKYKRATY